LKYKNRSELQYTDDTKEKEKKKKTGRQAGKIKGFQHKSEHMQDRPQGQLFHQYI
jgi:hypothetical protein